MIKIVILSEAKDLRLFTAFRVTVNMTVFRVTVNMD